MTKSKYQEIAEALIPDRDFVNTDQGPVGNWTVVDTKTGDMYKVPFHTRDAASKKAWKFGSRHSAIHISELDPATVLPWGGNGLPKTAGEQAKLSK